MAKDKKSGKANAEPVKKNKGGKGGDEFAKPSEAPASGDAWKAEAEENVGKLFLITPLRTQTHKSDEYGESEVVVADVVVLNEKKPEKSELHEDVYFFGGWTKGALRGYIGERKVLARLGQDASKTKSKAKGAFAWVLEDADDDDIAIAQDYLANVDPFSQKKGATKSDKGSKKK